MSCDSPWLQSLNVGAFDKSGAVQEVWRQGLVQGIDVEIITSEGVEVAKIKRLRISDRVKRLELIGKHVGVNAFQDVVQHKSLDGLADRVERALKRIHT